MSATAVGLPAARPSGFFGSTIGKKALMAVSGIILFGFVISHLIGNLQIFEGAEKINQYGIFLRSIPAALWGARITLLVMVLLHIWSSIQLASRKIEARPKGYVKRKAVTSTYASRTMYWSGPIILLFVIYHLLDFTFGPANPSYSPGDIYHNVIASFSVPWISAFYIVAMILLCMHLYHGLWSMFQSLGLHHPKYSAAIKSAAKVFAIVIAIGYISIPVSVMTGVIH